jgi:TRAP-type mannitol/chloroaromatic compound transport system permease small subunit
MDLALRDAIGTALSIVTIAAAVWLAILPFESFEVLYTLAVVLIALAGAAIFKSRPGWFAAASLLGWFSIMIAAPFSITTQQANGLRRQAGRGDEDAEALLVFYEGLAPHALWLTLALTALVFAIFAYGMARGRVHLHQNLLDASDGLARFCTRIGVLAAATLFVAMIFIIMYDVLQRKYLGFNPQFTRTAWYAQFTATRVQEMEWHLHAALFLLCLGYAYIKDAHVRIELVRDTMRPRTRVWVELLGCVLFMVPYCYVVMQYGTRTRCDPTTSAKARRRRPG